MKDSEENYTLDKDGNIFFEGETEIKINGKPYRIEEPVFNLIYIISKERDKYKRQFTIAFFLLALVTFAFARHLMI